MKRRMLTAVLISWLCTLSSCLPRQYHLIKETLSWSDAQTYCRQTYTDLATVENVADMNKVIQTVGQSSSAAVWIGLYDDVTAWKWSGSAQGDHGPEPPLGYTSWLSGQPVKDGQYCARIGYLGYWSLYACSGLLTFICVDGTSSFVFVPTPMSWTAAQAYCRQYHADLARVLDDKDNGNVKNMVPTGGYSWIGLYREPWMSWSDASNATYRNWGDGKPETKPDENCAAVVPPTPFLYSWDDWPCAATLNFVCYSVPPQRRTLRVKLNSKPSDVDLKDSAVTDAILQLLHQRLRDQGVTEDLRLTWSEQQDGKAFHQDEGHAGM